jgi:hypothetical protein
MLLLLLLLLQRPRLFPSQYCPSLFWLSLVAHKTDWCSALVFLLAQNRYE